LKKKYSSKNIKVLSPKAAIRKRPGMYFGDIEYDGANHIVYELVSNSIDLFLAGLVNKIQVQAVGQDISVSDDGPGFPFNKKHEAENNDSLVTHYLTHNHHAPTADNHTPHIHFMGGGLGLSVINAACANLLIKSSDGQHLWHQKFGRGEKLSEASVQSGIYQKGTQITIRLDPEVFGDYGVNLWELRKSLFEAAHLFPGLHIEFNDETFFSKQGLLDLARLFLLEEPFNKSLIKKFHFSGQKNGVAIQVAALSTSGSGTEYRSWVNGLVSHESGSHVNGLSDALHKANWTPEIAMIHVIMHNPKYVGPTKSALECPEVAETIEQMLEGPLQAAM